MAGTEGSLPGGPSGWQTRAVRRGLVLSPGSADEIAQPEPAAVEIASGPSIQSAEEPQAVAASVDEAPVETVPVDETPAVIEERVAEPAPVQEVAAAVDEVVGDAAPVAEVGKSQHSG